MLMVGLLLARVDINANPYQTCISKKEINEVETQYESSDGDVASYNRVTGEFKGKKIVTKYILIETWLGSKLRPVEWRTAEQFELRKIYRDLRKEYLKQQQKLEKFTKIAR